MSGFQHFKGNSIRIIEDANKLIKIPNLNEKMAQKFIYELGEEVLEFLQSKPLEDAKITQILTSLFLLMQLIDLDRDMLYYPVRQQLNKTQFHRILVEGSVSELMEVVSMKMDLAEKIIQEEF